MGHAVRLERSGKRFAIMVLYYGCPTFKLVGWVSPVTQDIPTRWAAYCGRTSRVVRRTRQEAVSDFLDEFVL